MAGRFGLVLLHGTGELSEEILELNMENPRRSGGGEVITVKKYLQMDTALVAFQDPQVAVRVSQRSPVTIQGRNVRVELLQYPNSIEVSNINPATGLDSLELHFESEKFGGGSIEKTDFHDQQRGLAIITFEDDETACSLLTRTEPLCLQGHTLVVMPRTTVVNPREVVVTGIQSSLTNETLELFFENPKRSGGGVLEELSVDRGKGEAVMVFEDEQVAASVLTGRTFQFGGCQLVVQKRAPLSPDHSGAGEKSESGSGSSPVPGSRMLHVTGLSPRTPQSTIEMFFENEPRSGGGEIERIDIDEESNDCVITFQDASVANRVTRRTLLVLDEQTLRVTHYSVKPKPSPNPQHSTGTEATKTVVVSGLSKNTSRDALLMYFESSKYSGGGEIEKLEHQSETGMAEVTYKDASDAQRVLQCDTLVLDGAPLTVAPVCAEGMANTILVEGLGSSTSRDTIEMFFESPKYSGGDAITNLQHDVTSGSALITYLDETVIQRVLKFPKGHILDNVKLRVSAWASKSTNQVLVEGINDNTTRDALSMFFESDRRCGGGDIDDIEYTVNSGRAVITFTTSEVAKKVIHTGDCQELTLDKSVLTVSKVSPLLAANISNQRNQESSLESDQNLSFGAPIRHEMSRNTGRDASPMGKVHIRTTNFGHSPRNTAAVHHDVLRSTSYGQSPRNTGTQQREPQSTRRDIPMLFSIRNIPTHTRETQLQRVLQTYGIHQTQNIALFPEHKVAVVHLNLESDSDRMSSLSEVRLDGAACPLSTLDISILNDPGYSGTMAIHVSGLAKDASHDMLELFFSNPSKSGGDQVSSVFINKDTGVATVTFPSVEIVEAAIRKHASQAFVIGRQKLHVVRVEAGICPRIHHVHTDALHYKLCYASVATLDQVNGFLSLAPSQMQVIRIMYAMDEETMLLQFMIQPDWIELMFLCLTKPLNGRMVTIEKLPDSCTIQIFNHTGSTDVLKSHFASSFNAQITSINTHTVQQSNVIIMQFADVSVYHRVLSRTEHKVRGSSIMVLPYYEEIGFFPPELCPETPWDDTPQSFDLVLLDKHVYDFLMKSSSARDRLDQLGSSDQMFHIDWSRSAVDHLMVCGEPRQRGCLDPKKRNPVTWEKVSRGCLNDFLSEIISDSVGTTHDRYDKLFLEAKRNLVQDDLLLVEERATATLIVAGWKQQVHEKIKSLRLFHDGLVRVADTIEDRIQLTPHQVEMIDASGIVNDLKAMCPEVKISLQGAELKFTGLPNDINLAKSVFTDNFLDNIITDSYDNIQQQELLSKPETLKYIREQMKNKGYNVVLQVTNTDLTMYAMSQDCMKDAKSVVNSSIKSSSFPVDDRTRPFCKSTPWKDLKKQLLAQHIGLLTVAEGNDTIDVTCITSIHDVITTEIQGCLKTNALKTEIVPMRRAQVRLLNKNNAKILHDIKEKYKGSMASFAPIETATTTGIAITASQKSLNKIKEDVTKLVRDIKTKDFEVTKPWLTKTYKSDDSVRDVELKYEVACEVMSSQGVQQAGAAAASAPHIYSSTRQNSIQANNINITLIKGSIAQQNVDVVVNVLKEDMDPTGTSVSKAVTAAAGQRVKTEIKRNKGIKFGDLFTTGPGDMPGVNAIYHVPIVHWDKKKSQSQRQEQLLRQMLSKCLMEANKGGMTSIALPSFGSGKWEWNCQLVAKAIVDEVTCFGDMNPGTSMREMNIVIYEKDKDTIQAYEDFFSNYTVSTATAAAASHQVPVVHPTAQPSDSLIAPEGLTVTIKIGSVTTEQVDVIVNTGPKDLNISSSGGVSKAIARDGGDSIQDELKTKSSLDFGQIVKTLAGKLPAKYIIHGACPEWASGKQECERVLRLYLQNVFRMASEDGMTSVAIPAIGTGNLNYPYDLVANVMFEEALGFSQQKPQSSLKHVRIMLFHQDKKIIKVFEDILHQRQQVTSGLSPVIPHTQPAQMVTTKTSITTAEGLLISIKKGSITKEKVDALVNSGSKDLELFTSGGVSKVILSEGGDSIQQELKKTGSIDFGEIVKTQAGNLPAKFIIHGACPEWKCGKQECEGVLRKYLKAVFSMAVGDKMSTIAIPAIGTGNLGYPRTLVANVIYEEAIEFSQRNPTSSLKEIRIVLFDQDHRTIKEFEDVLNQIHQVGSIPGVKNTQVHSSVLPPHTAPHSAPTATSHGDLVEKSSGVFECHLNNITITVLKGDITTVDADAIVTSTNAKLELASAGTSGAVLKAGGNSIQKECNELLKKGLQSNVVKTKSGKLKCKMIFHLISPSSKADWPARIKELLTEADKKGAQSIALPALGTGQMGVSASSMADILLTSVKDVVINQTLASLNAISVILFDDQILNVFRDIITKPQPIQSSQATTSGPTIPGASSSHFNRGSAPYATIRHMHKTDEPVIIRIYSMDKKAIGRAVGELEEKVREKSATHSFEDPQDKKLITKLDNIHRRRLLDMADTYRMHLTIEQDPSKPMIKLEGHVRDMHTCVQAVHSVLKDVDVDILADRAYKETQWGMCQSNTFVKFSPRISYNISLGLADQDSDDIQCSDGTTQYVIDFKSMTASTQGNTYLIRKETGADVTGLPQHWTNTVEPFNKVTLSVTDPEYIEVKNDFNATCPKQNVKQIERIQNRSVYGGYAVKKLEMERTCPSGTVIQRKLYHGTEAGVLDSINTNGFNRSYCGRNATAFGKGVYFAVDAAYSAQGKYSKTDQTTSNRYMYRCLVLTGEYTKGDSKYIEPPPKDPKDPNIRFNSVVDHMNNINMFVTFRDSQAYPEYLITFT